MAQPVLDEDAVIGPAGMREERCEREKTDLRRARRRLGAQAGWVPMIQAAWTWRLKAPPVVRRWRGVGAVRCAIARKRPVHDSPCPRARSRRSGLGLAEIGHQLLRRRLLIEVRRTLDQRTKDRQRLV